MEEGYVHHNKKLQARLWELQLKWFFFLNSVYYHSLLYSVGKRESLSFHRDSEPEEDHQMEQSKHCVNDIVDIKKEFNCSKKKKNYSNVG